MMLSINLDSCQGKKHTEDSLNIHHALDILIDTIYVICLLKLSSISICGNNDWQLSQSVTCSGARVLETVFDNKAVINFI